jgi:hypothetical protein
MRMSTGTLVLAPGALTHLAVAPSTGSVLTPVAAAVLTARAAVAGVEALAGGLEDAHRRAGMAAEARWEAAGRAAVHANSAALVLSAALRRAGAASNPACPPTPVALQLAGRSLTDVLAHAERVAAELTAARRYLAQYRRRAAGGAVRDPGEIDDLLGTAPADAEPEELADLYAAAAASRAAPELWRPQLALAVEQLRTNAARARRHATEAAAYLDGIAALDVDPADPQVRRVRAGLNEVVAGERDLSESLRDDTRLMIAAGERNAANRLLADRLGERFRADGFVVRILPKAGPYEVIEVTRPGRPLHRSQVTVGRGRISSRTVARRTLVGAGARVDAEWSAAVAGSIAGYGRELSDSGIGVHVVRSEPATGAAASALVAADHGPRSAS